MKNDMRKEMFVSLYLEQYALFLGELILTRSPQTTINQRTVFLRHVEPSELGVINKKLEQEEKNPKHQCSHVFYPTNTQINLPNMQVILTGDRAIQLEDGFISITQKRYKLSFVYKYGRLLLKAISNEG